MKQAGFLFTMRIIKIVLHIHNYVTVKKGQKAKYQRWTTCIQGAMLL